MPSILRRNVLLNGRFEVYQRILRVLLCRFRQQLWVTGCPKRGQETRNAAMIALEIMIELAHRQLGVVIRHERIEVRYCEWRRADCCRGRSRSRQRRRQGRRARGSHSRETAGKALASVGEIVDLPEQHLNLAV